MDLGILHGFGWWQLPKCTKKMIFTTGVTASVYRYNPGVIAQAFASLDVLYSGRMRIL